jgi:DNA-binding transcriptional regulator YdaS (Cro superfamily)
MEHLTSWLNAQRGRRGELAAFLKITSGALSQWTQVPADRAIAVEMATGISRHVLRPDVFGPMPEKVA